MQPLGQLIEKKGTTLNRTDSPIEHQFLWAFLNTGKFVLCKPDAETSGEGFFIHTQYPVGPYFADFIIIARGYDTRPKVWPPTKEARFAIECDGREFHSTDEQKAHDKKRDEYFREQGIETLRFTGSQIFRNADVWVKHIIEYLEHGLRK